MEALEESGIEGDAEFGQRAKLGGIVWVGGGKHSGGGRRGFGERRGLFKHGDARAAMMEFEGERETDDTGPSYADIRMLHKTSLVGPGEVIVWGCWFACAGERSERWMRR